MCIKKNVSRNIRETHVRKEGRNTMKTYIHFIKYFVIVIVLLLVLMLLFPTWTSSIKGSNSISVLEQVEINGTGHEMMIRGYDKENPVIIFVHGGPGCSEIPYAEKYQHLLETEFTVVHYDQRASGKSYHFSRTILISLQICLWRIYWH